MYISSPRTLLACACALSILAAPLRAQLTYEGLNGSTGDGSTTATSPWTRELRIESFDPFHDVPRMQNWVPDTDFDGGAAHCFAMTMLTYYAWKRLDFTGEPGLAPSQWTETTPVDTPIALDEDGMHFVMDWAFSHPTEKIRVAGPSSLREFTAEGTQTEELFRRVAEALQFSMQIPTNIGRYLMHITFSSVDLVPGKDFTQAGVNQKAFEQLGDRLAGGLLAPFTAHPARPRADGHVLLAYAMREGADTVEFDLYDSNYPPSGGRARPGKLIFQKSDWSYRIENYSGRAAYTGYELITVLKPDRAYEKQVFWRIVTNLDHYLAATSFVFDRLAEAQQLGEAAKQRWSDTKKQVKEEIIPRWQGRMQRMRERSRTLRRRLGWGGEREEVEIPEVPGR